MFIQGFNIIELLSILIFTLFVKFIYDSVYSAYYGPLRHIPGPKRYALSRIFMDIQVFMGTWWIKINKYHPKYGPVVRIRPNLISVCDHEAIKKILVDMDCPKQAFFASFAKYKDKPTLFTSIDKPYHKQRRRLLSHAFSMKTLASFEPSMHRCIMDLIVKIDNLLKTTSDQQGCVVNIYQLAKYLTSDIIGECAFGGSFELVKNGENRLFSAIHHNSMVLLTSATLPLVGYFMKEDPYLFEVSEKLLSKRRKLDSPPKADLLQQLLDAGLEDAEIIEQSAEFLFAGSDTNSFTLTMLTMLLVQNPRTLEKLYEELCSTLGPPKQSDELPKHSKLKELPYLNAVINETMRIWPITLDSETGRVANKDFTVNGILIPKGTSMQINIYPSLHSAELWGDDVDEFKPERWLDPEKIPNNVFNPFGQGSRQCIGMNFAMQEMRITVAALVHRYHFEEVPGQDTSIVSHLVPVFKSKKYNVRFFARHNADDISCVPSSQD